MPICRNRFRSYHEEDTDPFCEPCYEVKHENGILCPCGQVFTARAALTRHRWRVSYRDHEFHSGKRDALEHIKTYEKLLTDIKLTKTPLFFYTYSYMDEDYRYIPVTEQNTPPPTFQVLLEPEGVRILVAEGGEGGRPVPEGREVFQAPRISITLG